MSYSPPRHEIEDHVRIQVAVNFYDTDEIIENLTHYFSIDEHRLRPIVEAASTVRDADSQSWPDVTDCDRLDAAFLTLDREGIRARQHFACCSTCGYSEMTEDVHVAREHGETIDGYVFYPRPNAEVAASGGPLDLCYSTPDGETEPHLAIGRRICRVLEASGLQYTWDEATGAIQVLMIWQRRTWREREVAPWTAESALAQWCEQYGLITRTDFVASLGSAYPTLLYDKQPEIAAAWARAPSPAVLSAFPRARALAILARLSHREDVWREAWSCVPYGDHGILIELLIETELTSDELQRFVRLRILGTRRNVLGVAARTWFAVRTNSAEERDLDLAHRTLEAPGDTFDEEPRRAIAAALWILYHRRCDTTNAELMRAYINASDDYCLHAYSRLAEEHARREVERVTSTAPPSRTTDECRARVARLEEDAADGLCTHQELEDARYGLVLARAGEGDAVRVLAEHAQQTRDAQLAMDVALCAGIGAVRDGSALEMPISTVWEETNAERTLERMRATWQGATERSSHGPVEEQLRDRRRVRAGERILEAATVFARRGDSSRARTLIDEVIGDGFARTSMLAPRAIVEALCAVGDIDRAIERANYSNVGCEATTALVLKLVEFGRRDEAIKWLREAFRLLCFGERFRRLAPAVLAVATDRTAAAVEMLDAISRAHTSLDSLIPDAR